MLTTQFKLSKSIPEAGDPQVAIWGGEDTPGTQDWGHLLINYKLDLKGEDPDANASMDTQGAPEDITPLHNLFGEGDILIEYDMEQVNSYSFVRSS